MNTESNQQRRIVTAGDLKYLWIGLVCWFVDLFILFQIRHADKSLLAIAMLVALPIILVILVVMAFWKRHFFVGLPLLLIVALLYFMLPSRSLMRESADRMLAGGKLRETVIAMHSYHEKHGHMPAPAITAADGTPLLSWRVSILPYLGEEKLYQEFHLNEPWDSEHNRTLISRMPDVYKHVGPVNCPEHHTFIQAFAGPGTVLDPKQKVTLGEIAKARGTDKTIVASEGGHAVVWTKPEDIAFTLEQEIVPVGGQFPQEVTSYAGANIAFADGSVRYLRAPFPMDVLREAVQWQSKKLVEMEWE